MTMNLTLAGSMFTVRADRTEERRDRYASPLMPSSSFPHGLFSIHGRNAEAGYNLQCVPRDAAVICHRTAAIFLAF